MKIFSLKLVPMASVFIVRVEAAYKSELQWPINSIVERLKVAPFAFAYFSSFRVLSLNFFPKRLINCWRTNFMDFNTRYKLFEQHSKTFDIFLEQE